MAALRSVLFVIWLYGSLVFFGLLFLPTMLLPRQAATLGIRCWARAAVWGMRVICNAKTEVRGLENIENEPLLVASKHQSTLDTVLPFAFEREF